MKRAWLAAAALLPLALSACGDDQPAPVAQSFAPLHYEYLPKLRLNVGSVDVVDHSLPVGPQDVAASAPVVPAQALAQMGRDRLFAAGSSGTATLVIDQASIVREPNGAIDGQLAVHLDVASGDGGRVGHAEARVARQHVPGSEAEDPSANLYALTRDMMDAMNVELEYQVRQSLKPFLVSLSGDAPVAAQPLPAPGAAPSVPPPPPLPPATPDRPPMAPADGYQDPAAEPSQQMSPPPGYLQVPQQ